MASADRKPAAISSVAIIQAAGELVGDSILMGDTEQSIVMME